MLGTALLLERTRRRLAQAEVARRAGLDPSYLAAVERGRRRVPQPATIGRISAALGLNSAEKARISYLAAIQRMIESGNKASEPCRRAELAREVVAELATRDEWELRQLRALCREMNAARAAREGVAM
jgi:transcriptional regulator with XRE-family HTH domain